MQPIALTREFYDKVWGTPRTEPWAPSAGTDLGEIWFTRGGQPLPLLMKFIFTSQHLSVQVHPDDEYAARVEHSKGKTEMWHVLRADPGATLAIGLKETITRERLRESALSGELEHLLNWVEVHPGDTIFVPAGAIHAIGAGLVVCEIQQQSDITYRLYDYGRPRELHLDKGVAVSTCGPHPGLSTPEPLGPGEERLAACQYFTVDRLTITEPRAYTAPGEEYWLVIEGAGTLHCADSAAPAQPTGASTAPSFSEPLAAGQGWLIPAGTPALTLEGNLKIVRARVP